MTIQVRTIAASPEVLLRQVLPECLKEDGEPTSLTFEPWRRVDQGGLSVDRESLTTAERAFVLFTMPPPDGFGQQSVEVRGVSVEEACSLDLVVVEDPVAATATSPADPAHALIDFNSLARNRWGKVAKRLKGFALTRGRLYP